jgi:hypothetical protein
MFNFERFMYFLSFEDVVTCHGFKTAPEVNAVINSCRQAWPIFGGKNGKLFLITNVIFFPAQAADFLLQIAIFLVEIIFKIKTFTTAPLFSGILSAGTASTRPDLNARRRPRRPTTWPSTVSRGCPRGGLCKWVKRGHFAEVCCLETET